jgi:hypothetical protein
VERFDKAAEKSNGGWLTKKQAAAHGGFASPLATNAWPERMGIERGVSRAWYDEGQQTGSAEALAFSGDP